LSLYHPCDQRKGRSPENSLAGKDCNPIGEFPQLAVNFPQIETRSRGELAHVGERTARPLFEKTPNVFLKERAGLPRLAL